MTELLSVPILPLILTLAAFQVGRVLQAKFRFPFLNPILIAMILVLIFLFATGMPVAEYQQGMGSISWLLTPATICLAIPMYEQFQVLKKNLPMILAGVVAGSLSCMAMVVCTGLFLRFHPLLTVSLLPKSITTAIGVALTEMSGGMPGISTAAIIFTGILGSILGPVLCKLFHLTDPVAQGVAFGTAAHVIGTAKATELNALSGAVSSLSLVVAGLLTAVAFPLITAML